jgi:hypothetical protein
MDVQAELANAIKARHNKVYGIETPPPAPEKTKQKEKNTRQPVATNGIGKSSKNKAQKAAAAAIAAKMGKPAQLKPENKEKKGWKAPFAKKGSSGGAISSRSSSEEDKQTVEEYRKMLKRGLPEGAVLHKMQSNGVSKSIIDVVMSKVEAPAVVKQTQSSGSLSQEEEKIAEQYRKMKKMGLPDGAVTHKMIADGVSVKIQEAVLAGNSTPTTRTTSIATSSSSRNSGTNTNASGNISSLSRQDEATATPYRKMIKTGLPEGAVRHKMTMDGIEMHIQDSVLKGETAGNSGNTAAYTNVAATSNAGGKISSLSRKDEATATPYRKMIKTGLPEGAVRHKMVIDGIEMHIQDSILKGETAGNSGNTAANTNVAATSKGAGNISSLSRIDETTATPYRKMIKTGLPEGAVIHKMTMDGVEKHIQDSVLKGETPAPANDLSSGDTSSTRPVNPMACFLKKATSTETDYQPSKPSNPLAAAIAASGGQDGLKKASVNNNQHSPKPRSSGNILVDELAAKGFRSGLKKTPSQTQKPLPKASSSYNNLTDEISAKGFKSSFKKAAPKTSQPPIKKSSSDEELRASVELQKARKSPTPVTVAPKLSTSNTNKSSKGIQRPTMLKEEQKQSHSKRSIPVKPPTSTNIDLNKSTQAKAQVPIKEAPKPATVAISAKQPPKPKSANIGFSSKQKPVYVPPKPKSVNVAISSKQKPTEFVLPKSKPASIAVSSKQKQAVYVPPKPKSASVAVQKSVPTPVGKPSKQKKVDTQISPEMSMNNNKQPSAVTISRSEDSGNTQNKQRKKKVKNSSKKKKTIVNDEGAEQHCQCIVM